MLSNFFLSPSLFKYFLFSYYLNGKFKRYITRKHVKSTCRQINKPIYRHTHMHINMHQAENSFYNSFFFTSSLPHPGTLSIPYSLTASSGLMKLVNLLLKSSCCLIQDAKYCNNKVSLTCVSNSFLKASTSTSERLKFKLERRSLPILSSPFISPLATLFVSVSYTHLTLPTILLV